MKFEKFFSSSDGNFYVVTADNGRKLLIECGVTFKQMLKCLAASSRLDLLKIDGCLVTHEHADHAKCVHKVMENGIDVYASEGTFGGLGVDLDYWRRAKVVRAHDRFTIKARPVPTWAVMPFNVQHDTREPLGFIVTELKGQKSENLLFITDAAVVEDKFALPFDIVAITANYDHNFAEQQVKEGKLEKSVFERLESNHMSTMQALQYLYDSVNLSRCRAIYLLHMSSRNVHSRKRLAAKFREKLLFDNIIV